MAEVPARRRPSSSRRPPLALSRGAPAEGTPARGEQPGPGPRRRDPRPACSGWPLAGVKLPV